MKSKLDIISTKNTAYGYLSVSNGGLELQKIWNSYSINTKANIGPNNGKKYSTTR
jgi:allophanate hydrolase subunit 2